MLITVKERTREIGIRKALGATPFSVVSMILQESVFLTAIAGYLGMLGGIVVVQQFKSRIESGEIQTEFIMNPTIDFNIVLVSLSILVAVGAVAGLIPALNAARISPVVAMKGE